MKFLFLLLIALSSLSAYSKTSTENRAELDYEVSFQAGIDYKLESVQGVFSKYLDEKSLLGLKIGQGSHEDEKQFHLAAQYKYFSSNTFYIAPEIFYLNYSDELSFFRNERLTAMGAHLRIGNQWQWEHFSIGCDWFGIGKTFIFFNHQGDFDEIDKITGTVLNAYISYSF